MCLKCPEIGTDGSKRLLSHTQQQKKILQIVAVAPAAYHLGIIIFICLGMCPHIPLCVSAYCYVDTYRDVCDRILLYMCPNITVYVSAYVYVSCRIVFFFGYRP